jgi:hypothetical protein
MFGAIGLFSNLNGRFEKYNSYKESMFMICRYVYDFCCKMLSKDLCFDGNFLTERVFKYQS